jgi:hypothetical protein
MDPKQLEPLKKHVLLMETTLKNLSHLLQGHTPDEGKLKELMKHYHAAEVKLKTLYKP